MRKSILFEGVTVTLLLLLIFLLIAMIMGESSPSEYSIPGSSQVQYIYTGSDNTLYMFFDDHIRAVDATGNEMWDFKLSPQLKIAPSWRFSLYSNSWSNPSVMIDTHGGPIAFADNGTLYIYAAHNESYTGDDIDANGQMSEGLIAISGKGKELWSLPLHSLLINTTQYRPDSAPDNVLFSDAYIQAQRGRIYVFHGYNETVLNTSGSILWSADGVAAPASVDEYGFVYCVPAMEPSGEYSRQLLTDSGSYLSADDYLVPSAFVDAYYPNGTHYWREYPGESVYRQYISDERLPLYNNGTIYAPLENGVAAYDLHGNEKWTKKYNPDDFYFQYVQTNSTGFKSPDYTKSDFSIYGPMPFDSKGDVYVQYLGRDWIPQSDNFSAPTEPEIYLLTIGPDGNEIARNEIYQYNYNAVGDGIGFNTSVSNNYPTTVENLTDMRTKSLLAYDINDGKLLWNYTFPVDNPTVVTVNASSAGTISWYLSTPDQYYVNDDNTTNTNIGHVDASTAYVREVIAGNGRVYAQFSSVNFEIPVVYGESKAAYVSGVYALDENGSLLWSKTISPTASDMMVMNNSTILYRDNNGNLVVTGNGAAVGFALTAILYIFIRFICIGAVARARSRINKNENRNTVYDFILKNPGLTMYEVSRGLKMNLGTVRYHAFILGMNHRIVPYKDDGKYVRYFTNSNSYSSEDQLIVSLMRREAVGKVLMYMMTKPATPNADMARDLGLQESIVSRCVKELAEKGVITKEPLGTRSAYVIVDTRRDGIASAMRRIYGSIS
jgi:predicted transcriptional regulator